MMTRCNELTAAGDRCARKADTGMSVCFQHRQKSTALVKTSDKTIIAEMKETNDVVVFAQNPQEMEVAQKGLVEWATFRINDLKTDLADLEENLVIAEKRKWKVTPWRNRIRVAKKRVYFYEKVKAALEAGYCLVPNFRTQVFAYKTMKAKPKHRSAGDPSILGMDLDSDGSPMGEGRYVDPFPITKDVSWEDEQGNWHEQHRTDQFDEVVDFPFGFAKPQILDATGKAMAKKIFDEMGVLPGVAKTRGKRRGNRMRASGDPVVVGKIKLREGWQTKEFTFLISWFIDTRML